MSYVAFARRYRPKVFDEVVGQSHVTTTLKNAVLKERTGHAYIFAGPRGTGKTTTARILAKALNCEKGKKPDPCNACSACEEINKGLNLDVLEIDGASNRGIDEIRNLRDGIKFSPSKGRFKVYIIDEVHMLTPEAFNALLKILEEPPSHAKFIFATTAPHKVPSTILSRCQRFDFRRIATKDIFENLKTIAGSENLKVKDEALALIAKAAEGSMRDGQVILDQIASFTQGAIGPEDVLKILGLIDDEILLALSGAVKSKDAGAALMIIERLVAEGKDIIQVVLGLIEHFRSLLIIKTTTSFASLLDSGPENIKRLEEAAGGFTIEDVLYIIYTLSNTIDLIKKTNLSRVPFEAAMVKLANAGSIVSLNEIIARLDKLEGAPPQAHAKAENKAAIPPASTAPRVNPESSRGIDDILSQWAGVINYIKGKKISIASYLQEGYPVSMDANKLTIGFSKELQFHKEVLEEPENRRLIEEALEEVLKTDLKAAFIMVEPANIRDKPQDISYAPDAVLDAKKEVEPIIKDALDIFSGEIINRRNKEKS